MLEDPSKNISPHKFDIPNTGEQSIAFNEKYFLFFEHSPISLWIEDFSKVKVYIDSIVKENNTDIKNYLKNHPEILPQLSSLVTVKEVNKAALKLYNAKSKEYLLNNLSDVFTENSTKGFAKLLVDILLGKKETEVESINRTFDNKEIHVLIKFKVADDNLNSLENVIVSVENITDRVNTRKALAESESRYKKSQEIAKISSWFYDFNTHKLEWTDEAFRLIGMKPHNENLNKDFYLSFVHKDDLDIINDFSIPTLLKNPIQIFKYRIFTSKGTLKYIYEKRSVIIENNKIIRVIGILQDITESVLAEQKLNTTKNLLSNTLSSIKEGFVILDSNSNYLYVNKEAATFLGKKAQDLIGKNIWIEFPEGEGDLFYDKYQTALKTGKPISFENYFEPWDRWFENKMIPSKDGMLIFFNETTNQKISENKIKEAYNIINKSSSVAVLSRNELNYPVEFISENVLKLCGYNSIEFLTSKIQIHEIIYPDDFEYVATSIFNLTNSEKLNNFKPKPFRIITKNGEIKWVETNFDAIRNDQNIITHIQGIVEDITDKKNTEDLFFESNQRLKDQFNYTPLASIIWDLDFNVVEWNNSAQRIFEYTAEEAIGKNAKDLIIPKNIIPETNKVWRILLNQKGGYRHTNKNTTKSGREIVCEWYNVTLKDSKGNVTGVASTGNDITENLNSKKLLEKSEKKYRDIFEKSIDAVLILKNDRIIDCNDAAIKMFGFINKESLIKIDPLELSPLTQPDGSNSRTKVPKLINATLEKGYNRFRWYHHNKNGTIFPTEVTFTKINDTDEQSTIHIVVCDISEKVKKEELELVVYNISKVALTDSKFIDFGLFIKNELHKIIDTTNFYIALYNKETDMIHTPVLVDEKDNTTDFPAKNSLTGHVIKTKKPFMIGGNLSTDSNSTQKNQPVMLGVTSKNWVGVPLKIKDEVFGAIVVQSYTNENAYNKNDVQLLEFVANQISHTIQRKNTENELKKALIKAQESDKLKSAFLANMSHEIRTPMNGIIGFSELFLNSGLSENVREKYANIVINSSKRLLSIVNDILDISKIEAGVVQLYYENVNVNEQLNNHSAFYNSIASNNNIILKCFKGLSDIDSNIRIDKTKLNQILTNLLSNAFKFTEKGTIEFGYQLIGDNLQFYVKDTGIGVDIDLQHKIFERFTQANLDLNVQKKGTGLGLAISRKFVELFNGEIWINSNKEGTAIYFTIPYQKVKPPIITTVIEKENTEINVKNKIILIAEDEEYNMLYLNELFSNSNYKIIEAKNGIKAVELALKHSEIDLVLMDIKMPLMNGNDAMIEIKKAKPKLPIIALSAFAMESDKEKALAKGFDSYLTKPIDKKILFSVIHQFFS
jgi:PAS domain S-box-containing protein